MSSNEPSPIDVKHALYQRQVEYLSDKATEYFDAPEAHVLDLAPEGLGRVLEIGCGGGATLAALKERQSCFAVGIDIEPAAVERARKLVDASFVLDAEADHLPADLPADFDLLVMSYVLEHTIDPWRCLARWAEYVRPGGYAVIAVPNVAYFRVIAKLIGDDFPYEPYGVLDWTHLRHFTSRSLARMLDGAGFSVVKQQALTTHIGWKAQALRTVFPTSRRLLAYAWAVLARKDRAPDPAFVPFGPPFTTE